MAQYDFVRSQHRDAIVEMLAINGESGGNSGVSVTEIMQIPGVGTRENAWQILSRMVRAGEIERIGKGRYGPLRRRTFPAKPYAAPEPEVSPQPIETPPVATPEPQAPDVGYAAGARLDPTKVTPEQWITIANRYFLEDGAWISGWPRPGLPGCPLPLEIQALHRKSPPAKPPVAPIPAAPSSGANGVSHRANGARRAAEAPRPSMDLNTFCATISAMYVKAGLCPPFRLRNFAAALFASDIDPRHCLAVIERHLRDHAASCGSGSGDRLLPYLNDLIRHEWNNPPGTARRVHRYDELTRDLIEQELGVQEQPVEQRADHLDDYTARSKRRPWEGPTEAYEPEL
jgi:hypothetical protein